MKFLNKLFPFIALITCAIAAQEPTGIVMVLRHGARGPVTSDWDNTWGNMYGELTSVGIRQQFLRGAYFAKIYPNLFSKYDPNAFYVRSTDLNRTIMSAYSMLDGFFEGKGPIFSDNYPLDRTYPLYNTNFTYTEKNVFPYRYQAVPIHTVEESRDELLLSFSPEICPLAANLISDQVKDPSFAEVIGKFGSTISEVSKRMNLSTPLSLQQLIFVGDTIMANYFEGKPLTGGIDPNSDLGKNLTIVLGYVAYFLNAGGALQRQLFSMNPLNQFKTDLEQIIKGSNTNIKMYSAHDTTLIPILAVTGIATYECILKNFFENGNLTSCTYPAFASALRFEVWKNETDENSTEIRIYYDEVEQNLCKSANGHCTWGAFKELIQNYTQGKGIEYYRTTCNPNVKSQLTSDSTGKTTHEIKQIPDGPYIGLKYIVYGLSGFAGILFVGIIYAIGKRKDAESKADGYELNQ